MPKSTMAATKARVNQVYKMLLAGISRADIIEHSAKTWGLSPGGTDVLIKHANAIFAKQSEFIREEEFGRALNRLNNLYSRALNVQDYKTCLAVQRELSVLLGLNAPARRIEININIELVNQTVKALTDAGLDPAIVFQDLINEAARVRQQSDSEAGH